MGLLRHLVLWSGQLLGCQPLQYAVATAEWSSSWRVSKSNMPPFVVYTLYKWPLPLENPNTWEKVWFKLRFVQPCSLLAGPKKLCRQGRAKMFFAWDTRWNAPHGWSPEATTQEIPRPWEFLLLHRVKIYDPAESMRLNRTQKMPLT